MPAIAKQGVTRGFGRTVPCPGLEPAPRDRRSTRAESLQDRLGATYRQFREFPFTNVQEDPPWYRDLLDLVRSYAARLAAVMPWMGADLAGQEQLKVPAGDVIVVAQAPSNMQLKELKRFLERPSNKPNHAILMNSTSTLFDPAVYQWLSEFFPDVGKIAAAFDKSEVTRNEDASQQWNVRIDPFLKLEGMEVRYLDKGGMGPDKSEKGQPKTETFPAKGKEDADARLRFFAPGWWVSRRKALGNPEYG